MNRTLLVTRPLLNDEEVVAWALLEGLSPRPADQMHVTIAYSRQPVAWTAAGYPGRSDTLEISPGGQREIALLGSPAMIALVFEAPELVTRHFAIRTDAGASWDYPTYRPHVTLCRNDGRAPGPMRAYDGRLIFGAEIFREIRSTA